MPVQQHPIPQNVTQYQFHLVGDMTLKQFLQLAGGIVIGLIFYATGLPFFIKWPLIAVSVGLGAAMAFLPVEGRPLDQWLLAFFRSIYSPTIYTWQKSEATTPNTSTHTAQQTAPPQVTTQAIPPVQSQITPPVNTSPAPIVLIPTSPQTPIQISSIPIDHSAKPVQPAPMPIFSVEKQTPIVTPQPSSQPTTIPVTTPFSITTQPSISSGPGSIATFSQDLPIPHLPDTPNTIVGMTLTPQGKILESTIIEILKDGLTIRATKSNKLGQFLFAKPLDDGNYQLTADKEGNTFPTFDLKLEGKIIPPIQLKANQ